MRPKGTRCSNQLTATPSPHEPLNLPTKPSDQIIRPNLPTKSQPNDVRGDWGQSPSPGTRCSNQLTINYTGYLKFRIGWARARIEKVVHASCVSGWGKDTLEAWVTLGFRCGPHSPRLFATSASGVPTEGACIQMRRHSATGNLRHLKLKRVIARFI